MASPKIMFDKTEIVAKAIVVNETNKKKAKLLRLNADSFSKISFVPCKVRKLFKKVDSEKIVLNLRGYARPVEYSKKDNAAFYDSYKEGFAKFAKDNHVMFEDQTK